MSGVKLASLGQDKDISDIDRGRSRHNLKQESKEEVGDAVLAFIRGSVKRVACKKNFSCLRESLGPHRVCKDCRLTSFTMVDGKGEGSQNSLWMSRWHYGVAHVSRRRLGRFSSKYKNAVQPSLTSSSLMESGSKEQGER